MFLEGEKNHSIHLKQLVQSFPSFIQQIIDFLFPLQGPYSVLIIFNPSKRQGSFISTVQFNLCLVGLLFQNAGEFLPFVFFLKPMLKGFSYTLSVSAEVIYQSASFCSHLKAKNFVVHSLELGASKFCKEQLMRKAVGRKEGRKA